MIIFTRRKTLPSCIGSENECKQSLAAIVKLNQSKTKSNKKKRPVREEEESECDDPIESYINNEDATVEVENENEDDEENNALLIDQQAAANDTDQATKVKSSSQHPRSTSSSGQSNF